MNFTAEQMLSVARVVYSGQPAKIDYEYDEYIVLFGGDLQEFKPSLAGEDWQRAQACDVIVAADKLCEKSGRCFLCAPVDAHDILTASLLAILETTCKQMS